MEKSNIVQILPKTKPWDLQRYALSSFKFQDIDKNRVLFATDQQTKQAQETLRSTSIQQGEITAKLSVINTRIIMLILIVGASYGTSVWSLMQHIINPLIFIPAFSIAVICSLMLGKVLSGG
jgi:hypothetical protein